MILAAFVKPNYASAAAAKVLSVLVIMAGGVHPSQGHGILVICREVTLTKDPAVPDAQDFAPWGEVSHYPALSDSEQFNLAVEQARVVLAMYMA